MTVIEVDRKTLLDAVADVRKVIQSRSQPPYSMVRLVPRGRRLTVEASDTVDWLTASVAARADGPPLLVPPKALVDFLGASRHPTARLSTEDGRVSVALDGSSITLPGVDGTSWPQARDWTTGEVVPLTPNLVDGIRRVAVAASDYDDRPILCGINFDGTTIVATDSYRLAWMGPFRPAPTMLVHAARLLRALRHVGSDPTMVVGPHAVLVCGRNGSAVVGRIEGQFPNWRSLPAPLPWFPHRVTIDRAAAIDALKRCEKFAGADETTPVRLTVGDPGQLRLVARRGDAEWAEQVGAAWQSKRDRWPEVGLNPRYLREGLDSCTAERVTLRVVDLLKPVRIADGDFNYLLMPVRTDR